MSIDEKAYYCTRDYARELLHSIVECQVCDSTLINSTSPLFGELISRLHRMVDVFAARSDNLTHFYRNFATCVDPQDSVYHWFVHGGDGHTVSLSDAMDAVNWASNTFDFGNVQAEFRRNIDSSEPCVPLSVFQTAMKHEVMMKIANIFHDVIVTRFNAEWETSTITIFDVTEDELAALRMAEMLLLNNVHGLHPVQFSNNHTTCKE